MGRDKQWYKMVKILYLRNFWEKKRERLMGKREERERREKIRVLGLEAPFYVFLINLGTMECEEPRSSVSGFQILPFAILEAHWRAGGSA